MAKDSRKVSSEEAIRAEETSTLETLIRRRARGLIDAIVEEELEAARGAAESARVGPARQGYRHGSRERTLTTSLGPTTFAMPRARVRTAEGATVEWRSELVPRYQRRSERVDEAILGVYGPMASVSCSTSAWLAMKARPRGAMSFAAWPSAKSVGRCSPLLTAAPAWRRPCASNGRRWQFNAAPRTRSGTSRRRRRCACAKSSLKSTDG